MADLPYSAEALSLLRPRAKALLRKRMRQLRGSLPPDARARRSAAITARVVALPCWQAARAVALYASMPDELDTRGLLDDAVARGLDVALPVVGEGRSLTFRWLVRAGERHPTAMSAFGIDEPTAEAPAVDGFGRALYDNTLTLMPRAVRVAAVFAFQMIAEVPDEAHDQRVHFVVTDEDTYRVDDAP
jgi:5-formyltetrahydrofolate cyclo-ligase